MNRVEILGAVDITHMEEGVDGNIYEAHVTLFASLNLPFIYFIWWDFITAEGMNIGVLGARGHCEPTFVLDYIA